MTDRGQVFDLGYKPYEGERLGRSGAVPAIYRDGLRRVLGFRRRARSKIVPWSLIALALFPAIIFVTLSVFLADFGADADLEFFTAPQYFELLSVVTILFIALAASELLVPDRIYGTLSVYASRPLNMWDYIAARAASLATVIVGFLLVPQVLLLVGQGAVANEGFFSYVGDHSDDLWKSALTALVYLIAYAPLAFLIASLAQKPSFATGIYAGVMFVGSGATSGLVDSGNDIFALAALDHHPRYLRDAIFDSNIQAWIPERAGFDEWVSLVVIVVVAAISLLFIARRYRVLL
ncbi:MAG: hypothetical protein OEM22_02220 [Acidimicrobiia bacterium]|nr:hypothetical protein [Acidimicrobiia bacterium]MDH3470669.1 hypothetical protein [Acidimicrobiia bacterium]